MPQAKPFAVITGASRGIGKAVAKYFAEQGYDLALIAHNPQRLNNTAAELMQLTQGKVHIEEFALDIADQQAVSATMRKIIKNHPTIDVLFNNAGILLPGTTDLELEDFNRMIQVNLIGAFAVAKPIAQQMRRQGFGYIFNVASNAGKRAQPEFGGYGATKFGLVGLNEAWQKELAANHVKVTALCPSVTLTDMTQDFTMADEEKIQPQDIVKTVAYLLSLNKNTHVPEIIIKCRTLTG
jgi:3-oxoacyl-[acyl-carrier protein] reductase